MLPYSQYQYYCNYCAMSRVVVADVVVFDEAAAVVAVVDDADIAYCRVANRIR